ncbi:MAG TPA: glycosyltransferase [Anaerolineaceae bacterium]|nr:glycosyltransferase [Anaerolineaceae bacterium]
MSPQKRILVLYADAGFGHRSAANALIEALEEMYGDQIQIDMVNPLEDRRAPSILRDSQSDYDKMVRSTPELYKLGFQASDQMVTSTLFESALTVMLFEVMRDVVRRYDPEVIATTYPLYQAPLEAVFAISRRYVPVITIVTDLATVHRIWFNNSVDLCLVPTARVRELAMEAGLKPRQLQITGIPVHPKLSNETRSAVTIREELGWRKDLVTVLVVGSRRVYNLPEVLRALNHSGLPIQLVVVAGGDDELYGQFEETKWHAPTQVYNFVRNMPDLMHASDLVVCKAGGLIVTESLACGLPMILVDVIPGQETGNADYVVGGGAGEMGESPIEVLEVLYHWLQFGGELLARRAQNARQLGRPHAAYAVAEIVWSTAKPERAERQHRRILGRPKLLDLLRSNHIPVKETEAVENSES